MTWRISNIRNPILVSYVAKGMLPYRGLGSGIKRALEDWPDISFTDDRDACLFTATVHRKVGENIEETSGKTAALPVTSGKTSEKILEAIRQRREVTIPELAALIGVSERSVERNVQKLREDGRLRRVGPDKGGHWEVIEAGGDV